MNTHFKLEGKALDLCNAFGFLYPAEVCLIYLVAAKLPKDAIAVNIGAGVGTGSLALVEMRPDVESWTVDISEGGPGGGMANERNAFYNAGIPQTTRQILGDSHEVWRNWDRAKALDYLFIDGDHSADGLQKDIDGWLQFVKPGGYVLYHDYKSKTWADVTAVVDRNMNRKDWSFIFYVDTLIVFQRKER